MDYRSSVSGLIVLCLCAATPVAAQDKRALIDKMMEVTNISGQLQSGAQAATVRIITQIKKIIRRCLTMFRRMFRKK